MFIAYVNQTNNGCDYTIGCGKILWELKAVTQNGAFEELKRLISNEETGELEQDEWDCPFYKEIILFEVSKQIQIPLDSWYLESKEKEKNERIEYERLKAKYD